MMANASWACTSCNNNNVATAGFCKQCGNQRPEKPKDASDWKIRLEYYKFVATTPSFLVVFIVPWLLFAATTLLYTYFYMKIPFMCWFWTMLVVVLCVLGVLYKNLAGLGVYTTPLATSCFVAVLVATLLGLYIYDTAAIFPMFYDHARKYTNVVASESSAAVADAGKLTFNGQTKVDITKSVGYIADNGMVFCVAPVMGAVSQPRIEYWAAGIGCCTASGDFWCDSAKNPEAHAGVVVFDNNGWFTPARFPFYQKARAKAEAQWMLQSVGNPLYVRWVETDNLDLLKNYYATRALVNVIAWFFIFMILSALMSFGMWKPRSMI